MTGAQRRTDELMSRLVALSDRQRKLSADIVDILDEFEGMTRAIRNGGPAGGPAKKRDPRVSR